MCASYKETSVSLYIYFPCLLNVIFRVLRFETLKDTILGDDVSAMKKSKDLSYKLQEFVETKVRTPVKNLFSTFFV